MNSNNNEHPIIDTHAHLYEVQFTNDIADVIKRAEDVSIKIIIIPATNYISSVKSLELAEKFPILKVAVGIHPHQANEFSETEIEKIELLTKNKNVVAIGEIGLEYFYDFAPRELQKKVFTRQIELAQKYNLPIIVHTRDSISDAIEIVESYSATTNNLKGVFHCFGGSYDESIKLQNLGYLVSYPGIVTFKNSPVVETVKKLNLNFMLETDSPYLTPVPFRGERNEPAYIVHTLNKISEICSIENNLVAEATTKNAIKLFNLKIE